jgi:DUF1680 family protein
MAMCRHALTNGVLGIQYGPSKPGVMLYLLPLGVATTKNESYRKWGSLFNSFWCCYGTGIESFSKLADSIYFRGSSAGASTSSAGASTGAGASGDVLYITQYVSSTLNFTTNDGSTAVSLEQRSLFPDAGSSTVTISIISSISSSGGGAGSDTKQQLAADKSVPIDVKLLLPAWLDGVPPTVLVNGKPIVPPASSSSSSPSSSLAPPAPKASFMTVSRTWSAGDTLSIHFPRSVRLVRLTDTRPAYASSYSFVYGDTLLVGVVPGPANPNASNALTVPSLNASEWTSRSGTTGRSRSVQSSQVAGTSPLRFSAKTLGGTMELTPLNEVAEERYTVYFNVTLHSHK